MAGHPAQETRVQVNRPGSILGNSCAMQGRGTSQTLFAVRPEGGISYEVGWFVPPGSHPACQTFSNLRNLRESVGDGLSFSVSSAEARFHPGAGSGLWLGKQFLRVTRPAFVLQSPSHQSHSWPVRELGCGLHCANLPCTLSLASMYLQGFSLFLWMVAGFGCR